VTRWSIPLIGQDDKYGESTRTTGFNRHVLASLGEFPQLRARGVTIDFPPGWTESEHARMGVAGSARKLIVSICDRPNAWPIRRLSVLTDRALYRLTGGRWSITAVSRIPSLMLMVTKPSGETAAVPLQFVLIGDHVYVVGTNWCRPKHPLWSSWLSRNPECIINVTGREWHCRATLVEGVERAELWPELLYRSAYYGECERRSQRVPRVFRLERIAATAPR
jgi:deazaflavin-dependent oxidoreductase (nitroreductase family)